MADRQHWTLVYGEDDMFTLGDPSPSSNFQPLNPQPFQTKIYKRILVGNIW